MVERTCDDRRQTILIPRAPREHLLRKLARRVWTRRPQTVVFADWPVLWPVNRGGPGDHNAGTELVCAEGFEEVIGRKHISLVRLQRVVPRLGNVSCARKMVNGPRPDLRHR